MNALIKSCVDIRRSEGNTEARFRSGNSTTVFYLIIFSLTSLYFLLSAFSVRAQQYSYTHYDIKDGLAGTTVNGMAQDKAGFIWFSTETGLSRFDGTNFRNFTRENGLPSSETFAVFADSKNRIWIIPYKNAICYYWKGVIHNQQNDTVLKKIKLSSEVNGLAEDAGGNILIKTQTECFILQANRKVLFFSLKALAKADVLRQKFKLISGVGEKFPSHMISDKIAPDFMYVSHLDNKNFSPGSPVSAFILYDTVALLDNKAESVHFVKMLPGSRIKLVNDSILAVMGDAVTGTRFYNISQKKITAQFLTGYTVQDVFKDIEGNLWFSTKESGVYKLSRAAFRSYFFGADHIPVAVLSIFKNGKGLFVGTGKAQCWQLDPAKENSFRRVFFKDDNAALKMLQQPLWINYASSDFLKLEKSGTVDIKTLMIFQDTVLTSDSKGAFLKRLKEKTIIKCLHEGRTTCAYKKDNVYYIGTLNGLYTITGNGKEVFLGDSDRLFRNRISSFAPGDDGVLWMATYENGVIGYKEGKVVANITQNNGGLSSNICRCLYYSGNSLWVGTEKGLNKIDLKGKKQYKVVAKFTMADGLTSDIINTIYVEGHCVYAGTANGLVYFDETRVPEHSICYIRMTGIHISEKTLDPETPVIKLPHTDNNISFEFAGISFLSEGNITYRYRLLGLNDQWKTTKASSLSYPSLPSGKYTLEVIAVNKFNDQSALLTRNFEVEKSLSEKYWFRTLILALAVGIIWLLIQIRFSALRKKQAKQNRIQQQMLELEHMALRAQMNPHFIFNCLNSVQLHILNQDSMGANLYLSQFAGLVRQTLENAAKTHISLREELAYLTNYIELEKLQIGDNFSYSITVDPLLDKDKVSIPNMVIQPYVENAIKHGIAHPDTERTVSLTFSLLHHLNVVECIVEDNGRGIAQTGPSDKKNKTHNPKGLSITQNRIETLNQMHRSANRINVSIQNVLPEALYKGTKVTVQFPLHISTITDSISANDTSYTG